MTGLLEERRTMTLEEFLALPEEDEQGNHFELDEGELVTLSPTGAPHARRVVKICSYLDRCLDPEIYDVLAGEAGIIMAVAPKPIVRGIDIAVLWKKDTPARGMLRTAPLLAVEVISPGNDPIDIERKRRQYQQFDVAEVWFVYEETKTIHVSRGTDTTIDIYTPPDKFDCRPLNTTINTGELFR